MKRQTLLLKVLTLFCFYCLGILSTVTSQERFIATKFSQVTGEVQAESNVGSEGGTCVGYITNGTYASYNTITFNREKKARFHIASDTQGGDIELRLDSPNGKLIGTVKVPNTNGWYTFQTKQISITPVSGNHKLYLVFKGGAGYLFNVAWFEFFDADTKPVENNISTATITNSRIEAVNFAKVYGEIRAEKNTGSEGGKCIGFITDGDYAVYKNINLSGVKAARFRVASDTQGGNIELRLDSPQGKLLGTVNVTNTKGWYTYQNKETFINTTNGTHDLYLVFRGGSGYLLNVNWFEFLGADTSSGGKITSTAINPNSRIEAVNFAKVYGEIKAEKNTGSEGGKCIGFITNGDYAVYKNINLSGVKAARFRVASDTQGGNIELRLDSPKGKLVGTVNVTNTQGWYTYQNKETFINTTNGTHDLYLVFQGGSGYLLNVNWFEFFE